MIVSKWKIFEVLEGLESNTWCGKRENSGFHIYYVERESFRGQDANGWPTSGDRLQSSND